MDLIRHKQTLFFSLLFFTFLANAQYNTSQKVFSEDFPSEIKKNSKDTYVQLKDSDGNIIVAIVKLTASIAMEHAYKNQTKLLAMSSQWKNLLVGI
mgnify:CR=1 FL=1